MITRLVLVLTVVVTSARVLAASPSDVEHAHDLAGDNRGELEQVLEHYRDGGDAQKLEAAEFLVANMDGHGYVEHAFFDASNEMSFAHGRFRQASNARSMFSMRSAAVIVSRSGSNRLRP